MSDIYRIWCLMYNWSLDSADTAPAYVQLAAYLKKLIIDGVLLHGQALLSQRDCCDVFGVSRPTIDKAFELLEQEHLIKTEPKKRAIVALSSEPKQYPTIDWQHFTKRGKYAEHSELYKRLNFIRGNNNIINMYECYFGNEFDPQAPVKRAMEAALQQMGYHNTNLDIRGTLPLRQAICNHLSARGVRAEASQVLVCNTLQNAYNIVFQAFSNEYTSCLLEEESLFIADKEINGVALPMDNVGILPPALLESARARRRCFLMVDTCYNMPRGVTYSTQRKRELLKIAAENMLPVVESEVVRDCWHTTPPSPPMKALDINNNVVYIYSLARPFMTMLTTAIVAPESLMPILMDIKLQSDEYTDIVNQTIMEKLLSRGIYTDYMDSIRPLIRTRREQTETLLRKYFNGIASWSDTEEGVNLRIEFPFNISKIFPMLEKSGIMLYSPEMFSSSKNFLWFCYTGADIETLDYAFRKIYHCLKSVR